MRVNIRDRQSAHEGIFLIIIVYVIIDANFTRYRKYSYFYINGLKVKSKDSVNNTCVAKHQQKKP